MTINTPFPSTAPPHDDASVLRRLAGQAGRWWKDVRAGSRKDEPPVALRPFSFWPGKMSLLSDEAGTEPAPLPGYAFHTDYIPSMGGRLTFKIHLAGLSGTHGELLLHINGLNENGESLAPKTVSVPIDKLVAADGLFEMIRLGEKNCCYALLGTLSPDSDAHAERIEISLTGGDSSDALEARLAAAQREFLAAPGKGPLRKIIARRRATVARC